MAEQTPAPVVGRVNVLDPGGKSYNIPTSNVQKALAKGWSVETPEQQWARENPGNAVMGAIYSGMNKATLGGLDKVSGLFETPEHAAAMDPIIAESEKRHPYVTAGSELATTALAAYAATPLLAPAGAMAEGAVLRSAATQAALSTGEKALTEAGLNGVAQATRLGFAKQVAARGINYATQGALMSLPAASVHAFQGDPALAAETLAWGSGTGFIFGSLGRAASLTKSRAAGGLFKALASEGGTVPAAETDQALNLASNVIKTVAGSKGETGLVGSGIKYGAKLAGGLVGGTLGGAVGHPFLGASAGAFAANASEGFQKRAADVVREVMMNWSTEDRAVGVTRYLKRLADDGSLHVGAELANTALSTGQKTISKVPTVLAAMSTDAKDVVPKKEKRGGKQQEETSYAKASEAVKKLNTDPNVAMQAASWHSAIMDGDPMAREVGARWLANQVWMVKWLDQNLPKAKPAPGPFDPNRDEEALPPLEEQMRFMRKFEVAQKGPGTVLDHLKDGTLTREHMDAAQAFWPRHLELFRMAVAEAATMSDAPKLDYPARVRLSMFLGKPIEPSMKPGSLAQTYQDIMNQGAPPQQQGPGSGNSPKNRGGSRARLGPKIAPPASFTKEIDSLSAGHLGKEQRQR